MKPIFETSLILETTDGNLNPLMLEFNRLLIVLTNSITVDMLKYYMKLEFEKSKNFAYGFGSSHLWVKQIVNNRPTKNRLVIVEF